jgi:hypothetical protein
MPGLCGNQEHCLHCSVSISSAAWHSRTPPVKPIAADAHLRNDNLEGPERHHGLGPGPQLRQAGLHIGLLRSSRHFDIVLIQLCTAPQKNVSESWPHRGEQAVDKEAGRLACSGPVAASQGDSQLLGKVHLSKTHERSRQLTLRLPTEEASA